MSSWSSMDAISTNLALDHVFAIVRGTSGLLPNVTNQIWTDLELNIKARAVSAAAREKLEAAGCTVTLLPGRKKWIKPSVAKNITRAEEYFAKKKVAEAGSADPVMGDDSTKDGENISEEVPPPIVGGENSSNKRKKKQTSNVWEVFTELPKGEDGLKRATCKLCGVIYISDSKYGTGNMKRHILVCPKLKTKDIGQLFLAKSEGSMSLHVSKFDQEKYRELMTMTVVKHELPFQFVDYEGVRILHSYLCDEVKHISRNTAKADVLKMYRREKNKLKDWLHSIPGRISLTSDLWTSITTDGYLCLMAHFVDENWVLQKKIINFCAMPTPHTGIALSDKIYTLLTEWGIEKKLFSITLDNASANDLFVELLRSQLMLNDALLCDGDFFHVRCCAHILNLIVQEGLKEIDDSVFKIRESIKYVKGSQVRKQRFAECVKQVSLNSSKGLRQDVPTRWNSTYLMLDSAIIYCRAFLHLQLSDSNYKYCPSQEEWGKAEKICKFLKLFYDVTSLFSGSIYPTANLYFSKVVLIQLNIMEGMRSSDNFISHIATQMNVKFEKYWKQYSIILAIAIILDPRFKIHFVEFSYNKLYGSSYEMIKIREKLFALFDYYVQNTSKVSNVTSSATLCKVSNDTEDNNSMMKEFDSFESFEFVSKSQKSQLELYLEEPRIDRSSKLDILNYWKSNQFRYPDLSLMACDILSIPISTVASESAFSFVKFEEAIQSEEWNQAMVEKIATIERNHT
ncbi:zinc finger BED domain-containing protein RICESLEEPER 1-like [Typha angustifolia]|uniref:zinc finger BED domain-containing protein RICESLEEPER 1-like n=1 Tax=Typha angustifolia TaxID=59011 RepID=UPI003C2D7788